MGNDREMVKLLFMRARERARTEDALAEIVGGLTGRDYSRQAINNWTRGRRDPPAHIAFGVARHYRISLDELLMSDEERQTLEEKVEEMRRQLVIVKNELDRQRAVRGEPPLEYPEAIESA